MYKNLLAKYLVWYVDEDACYYNSWQCEDCLFDTWAEADAHAKELVSIGECPTDYNIDTFSKHFEENLSYLEETA
jgi:hypothetical protein